MEYAAFLHLNKKIEYNFYFHHYHIDILCTTVYVVSGICLHFFASRVFQMETQATQKNAIHVFIPDKG